MMGRDKFTATVLIRVLGIMSTIVSPVTLGFAEDNGAFEAPVHKGEGKSRKVFVDLQPSEVCNFGDLDLVLNELRASNGALRLQLSVEELGVKDGVVVFGQPLEKKFEGTNMGTYEVHLPEASETKVYGVFFCSVAPEELSKVPCSSKRLLPFDQMFKPYNVDVTPLRSGKAESAPYTPPTEVEPKVYFSQFLVDGGTSLWALKDSASKDGAKIIQGLGVSKAKSDEVTKVIERFSGALGSLPLRSAEDRLQMILPLFSDKKCNG
jgi:hypothetical protein